MAIEKRKKKSTVYDVSGDVEKKKKKREVEEDDDEDDEEDVKPKKKKSKSRALALRDDDDDEPETRKLNVTKTKLLLKTQFGKDANKILNLLEREENDPAIAMLYKKLLMSVVDILPMAEMGIRKTKGVRGIHGFTMLISQIRELMVDIQAAQDRGMMGEMITQQFLQPAFRDLAQDTVKEFSNIAADAKSILTQEDYDKFTPLLREARSRLANDMTRHYNSMKDGVIGYLQR